MFSIGYGALLELRCQAAARLGDPQQIMVGSLTEQMRRCGKRSCRCHHGNPHGPYVYLTAREGGARRQRYVPTGMVDVVRRHVQRGAAVEAVLAQISAINAELFNRRQLR